MRYSYYCIMKTNPDGSRYDATVAVSGFSGFEYAEDARLFLAWHLAGTLGVQNGMFDGNLEDLRRRKDLFLLALSEKPVPYYGGNYTIEEHDMCQLRKTLEDCRVICTRNGPYIKDKVEPVPMG